VSNLKAEVLGKPQSGWRLQFYTVIFEADTRAGRRFDQVLIAVILTSVAVVVADSVHTINQQAHRVFTVLEWGFTLIFTLEYIARLACVRRPWRYVFSFYGVIDLLALLPTYLALLVPEVGALIDVRILRLLRVFRIFKLTAYVCAKAGQTGVHTAGHHALGLDAVKGLASVGGQGGQRADGGCNDRQCFYCADTHE